MTLGSLPYRPFPSLTLSLPRALTLTLTLVTACGGASDPPIIADSSGAAAPAMSAPGAAPAGGPDAPPAKPGAPEPPTTQAAPAGLTCLAKHFVGTPANNSGASWSLRLPDGTELPWNDGLAKTFDGKMEHPDLHDTLSMPYGRGPITPVSTVNADPGRIRSDVLFKATYGGSAAAVEQALVNVDFVGQTVKFHPRAAAALGKVSAKLKTLIAATPSLSAYLTGELGGTFQWRPIANTTRLSAHSYGVAIDIVVSKSNYWEWEKNAAGAFTWKNQIPQAIVDAFEAEGFAWGGRWYHYDTMHFEYRPELFDPVCTP